MTIDLNSKYSKFLFQMPHTEHKHHAAAVLAFQRLCNTFFLEDLFIQESY